MTIFKQLALAAALALVGVTGAQAATEIGGEYVPMDPGAPGDFTNTWTLSNADFLAPAAAGGTEKGTKGDSFIDWFQFNVPESEYVTFGFSSQLNPTAEVSFTGWVIGVPADGSIIDSQGSLITNALQGPTYFLASGTYEIDVFGTFKQRGGLFDGYIMGNVPEPSSWALMLAGVGAIGALARRRKARAQA
ncbi:MAG TPA: FxDxF family PEP-CTERM protein [Burkholderiaceae bacterium]